MNDHDEAALFGDPMWGRSYEDVTFWEFFDKKTGIVLAFTSSPDDPELSPSIQKSNQDITD